MHFFDYGGWRWRMAFYVAEYKAIAIAIGHRVKVLNLRQNGDAS